MRKLATIRRIAEIKPIENADALELAIIDGWQVVTKKDEHQAGGLVVFCEVDSFLPIKDEYEFLRKSSYKKMWDGTEGFRLKTIRLRGVLSQGLVLPVTTAIFAAADEESRLFSEEGESVDLVHDIGEGADVTELLGIVKWDTPPPGVFQGQGKGGLPLNAKGNFPEWIPKTEEERIQNCWNYLPKDVDYVATEKLHGTSATYYLKDGVFGMCSRNLDLKPEMGGLYAEVANEYGIEQRLRELATGINIVYDDLSAAPGIALQGEIIGEGINGNYYGIERRQFFLFNVYSEETRQYLPHDLVVALAVQLGLQHVPVLSESHRLPQSCAEALAYAEAPSTFAKQPVREGIVLRHYPKVGPRVSVKVISNAYLLKEK